MKKIALILSLVLTSILHAEEFGDTFKIRVGGYLVANTETIIIKLTFFLT